MAPGENQEPLEERIGGIKDVTAKEFLLDTFCLFFPGGMILAARNAERRDSLQGPIQDRLKLYGTGVFLEVIKFVAYFPAYNGLYHSAEKLF